MYTKDDIRRYFRVLNRTEQTSLCGLFLCKLVILVQRFCHLIQHKGLSQLSKSKLKELTARKAKDVIVFANGPSLRDLDFTKVKELTDSGEYDLIVVNSFASKAIAQYGIVPFAGIFNDPAHYGGCPDHPLASQFQEDIDTMNEFNIPTIVPYRYVRKSKFNNTVPICGFRDVYSQNVSNIHKPTGFYGLTAFYALALAMHLKYQNIYVCGYDNSYFKSFGVDMNNEKYLQDEHFYDDESLSRRWMPTDLYGKTCDMFYDTYRHFMYLEKIAQLCPREVKIWNIAKTTYTDAFPRNFDLDIYK
ncbi:hypothetical protein [Persicirhabdus sediminis]|uniref:Uncharacterized protein n=1 Tax=Persicirhabdus sediminis TaxID=454144 RepID=A0A8J7MFY5_9BACT|nr:hypothetical protein [Persicirhabdus sediminis]MBK1792771.1 hypothetical protein [Persicirhabdus sediminis]